MQKKSARTEGVSSWDPFSRPRPTIDCLTHEAVLVQAWKKSHDYIRSRNWYADVLELDHSAAALPELIQQWQADFEERGVVSLEPTAMRVVPAPKTWRWEFKAEKNPEWRPEEKTDKPFHLRPLAHLDIRSQTLFSALMICLADVVEGEQGNPALPVSKARQEGVVSYGNRLFCDFAQESPRSAKFRWGNATSYRKYFEDYQTFLRRPKEICRELIAGNGSDQLAVISLDLSGFYDRIKPNDVIHRLKRLCRDQGVQDDSAFWEAASKIMAWEWDSKDKERYGSAKLFKDDGLPRGLPQGGVASGFFSNVAMLDFDAEMFAMLSGDTRSLNGVEVLDYTRYVDDIRLVVRHLRHQPHNDVLNSCASIVKDLLSEHAEGQSCNDSKSEYLSAEAIETRGSDALIMEAIQTSLSGPMDSPAMEDASLALQGLLNSVDDLNLGDKPDTATLQLDLARIHTKVREVRDDTIVRFVAYRQFKLLHQRYEMLGDEGGEELVQLRAEMDLAARKLVHHWAHDPSLNIVLRCALNLMPSKGILRPIKQAMDQYIGLDSEDGPRLAVLYGLADLLKSSATHRHLEEKTSYMAQEAKPFFEMIGDLAAEVIIRENLPWYVQQQAAMALLALGRASEVTQACENKTADHSRELELYWRLALVIEGKFEKSRGKHDLTKWPALSAVAAQLSDEESFRTKLSRYVNGLPLHQAQELAGPLVRLMPDLAADLKINSPFSMATPLAKGWVSLTDLIESKENPFAHEAAALTLLKAILKSEDFSAEVEATLPIGSIQIQCKNLKRLAHLKPGVKPPALKVRLAQERTLLAHDPYGLPSWARGARRWLMSLGMVIRSSFVGSRDYTQCWRPDFTPAIGYRGIRSSWFKRRYGMFHRPDGLGGPSAACSSWFAELLTNMLAWPGAMVREAMIPGWDDIESPDDLLRLISQQLKSLRSMYATSSGMPVYVHQIGQNLIEGDTLTVAMIQTVRPWRDDFAVYGTTLSDARYTKVRRDHLAIMLRLAESHSRAKTSYERTDVDGDALAPRIHLTVLPEFAVHEDDLDLVERYVDRTRSIVFCGLVFHPHPNGSGLVNTGRWVIRDQSASGRSIRHIAQGKLHMTEIERKLKICGHRPHQVVISVVGNSSPPEQYAISGCLCFDATDLSLARDLRDLTDMMLVPANNKDVDTFDALAASLNYLMYQHIAIVNTGEFGGTLLRAPYKERHERVLTHQHGGGNASVTIVDVCLSDYRPLRKRREMKERPAAYRGRPRK